MGCIMRWPLVMTLPLLLGSAAPQTPDVIRAGEVMATLNDWRAILFIALFLSIALLGALIWVVAMSFRLMQKTATALAAQSSATTAMSITLSRLESRLPFGREQQE